MNDPQRAGRHAPVEPSPHGEGHLNLARPEEALREVERRYRSLVEAIPAIAYITERDGQGAWTYVSPQVERILGYPPLEWTNRLWLQLMDPEDRPRVKEQEERSWETGEPFRSEYRLVTRDRGVVWVRDEGVVVPDARGRPAFLQGVMYDITERKEAEEALQEAYEREREAAVRLRSLDEMKNAFLSAVSHELRTPLSAILGFSLTLDQESERLSPEQRKEMAQRLVMQARKLDRLLSDLLDLERLTRGIMEPHRMETDVTGLLNRVVAEFEGGDHPILADAEPVVVSVDPFKVERIVENLLANAVRHTPPGTTVIVRIRPEGDGVLISVDDEGPGIPEELKKVIFEPFRHGEPPSQTSGTGIGLSLVFRFAEMHGGRAWVEDRPGGGSSFRVVVPGPGPAAGA